MPPDGWLAPSVPGCSWRRPACAAHAVQLLCHIELHHLHSSPQAAWGAGGCQRQVPLLCSGQGQPKRQTPILTFRKCCVAAMPRKCYVAKSPTAWPNQQRSNQCSAHRVHHVQHRKGHGQRLLEVSRVFSWQHGHAWLCQVQNVRDCAQHRMCTHQCECTHSCKVDVNAQCSPALPACCMGAALVVFRKLGGAWRESASFLAMLCSLAPLCATLQRSANRISRCFYAVCCAALSRQAQWACSGPRVLTHRVMFELPEAPNCALQYVSCSLGAVAS